MLTSTFKVCIPLLRSQGMFSVALKSCQYSTGQHILRLAPMCHAYRAANTMIYPKHSFSRPVMSPFPSSAGHLHVSAVKSQAGPPPTVEEQTRLLSQMHIRLVNENSFLSWCRNAYLSTVVGVAMMTEGTSALAQSAGLGALIVGTMNLVWGTGCHVTNLIRLRHVSGMSSLTLVLHLAGSLLHCFLWAFVLICYVGFLDESRFPDDEDIEEQLLRAGEDDSKFKRRRVSGDGSRRF